MATAFAIEAAHIQKTGHLSVADLARATGTNETTVRAWLRGSRSPSGALAELSSLVERLPRVMEPSYVPVWLRKPVPLLDDDKPLDVIAAGDSRRVSRVIARARGSGRRVVVGRRRDRARGRLVPPDPGGRGPAAPPAAPGGFTLAARLDRRCDPSRRERADRVGGALAEAALPPGQALPRDLWRWEIDLARVAGLSTEAQRARVGLPSSVPTR